MKITSAQFVISNSDYKKCPKTELLEFAFVGRSNVGKSSLINMLCSHKDLAKTSGKPGKTQLINHFMINKNEWYLVDLPGYGYARTSKENRGKWHKMISDYFTHRENLFCTFILIDVRLEAQKIDLEFIEWMGENGLPFALIFTKADKISPVQVDKNVAAYKREMLKTWEELPPMFISSSETQRGKEEILDYIDTLLKMQS